MGELGNNCILPPVSSSCWSNMLTIVFDCKLLYVYVRFLSEFVSLPQAKFQHLSLVVMMQERNFQCDHTGKIVGLVLWTDKSFTLIQEKKGLRQELQSCNLNQACLCILLFGLFLLGGSVGKAEIIAACKVTLVCTGSCPETIAHT